MKTSSKFSWNVPGNFIRLEQRLIAETESRVKCEAQIAALLHNQSLMLEQLKSLVATQSDIIARLDEQQSQSDTLSDNLRSGVNALSSSHHEALQALNDHFEALRTLHITGQENELQELIVQLDAITKLDAKIVSVGGSLNTAIVSGINTLNSHFEALRSLHITGQENELQELVVQLDAITKLAAKVGTLIESVGRIEKFGSELIPINSQYYHRLSDAQTEVSRINDVVSEIYAIVLSNFNALNRPKSAKIPK